MNQRKISLDLTQYSADYILLVDDIVRVIERNLNQEEIDVVDLEFDSGHNSVDFNFRCSDDKYNQIRSEIPVTMGIIV